MKSASIHLVDRPISIKNYKIYNVDILPKLVLGYKVKNKFDENRFKIKTKYRPRRILHFKRDTELEPVALYGIELKIKPHYKPLLTTLNSDVIISHCTDRARLVQWYKQLLSQYNLSCDECFSFTSDGFYPVDIKHLDSMTVKSYKPEIDSGFTSMMSKSELPWYLNINNVNLFILSKSIGY